MTIRLALVGSSGRMGCRIDALAAADPALLVVARIDQGSPPAELAMGSIDAVIDFSSEQGARTAMEVARASGAALLVGTTGLSKAVEAELRALSNSHAVLVAPNTSLGVAVTRRLARLAAELLGPHGWSVDVVESHHDRKKDAPSGTALAIARSLEEGGMPVAADRIHAIRAGDTIGEHEIRLAGPSERIHIMHQAVTRDLFAAGALRAARWLAGRPAGWYSIEDSLG
ncbi:MAG: 4-hydroxy-tetrahydrodipicolinate reductase [Phycisphaerales bacterium]